MRGMTAEPRRAQGQLALLDVLLSGVAGRPGHRSGLQGRGSSRQSPLWRWRARLVVRSRPWPDADRQVQQVACPGQQATQLDREPDQRQVGCIAGRVEVAPWSVWV